MTDEIEVYRASAEAALNTFSEQTGLLGPVKQRFDYLKQRIYYRQLPNLAREATLAAQKIRTLNLPLASVEDPIVLRILEEGSWADDEDMQVVWANLLVNAITEGTPDVHAAFRVVLDQLEPVEARTLNHLADKANFAASPEDQRFTPIQLVSQGRADHTSTTSSASACCATPGSCPPQSAALRTPEPPCQALPSRILAGHS
ncbi:MAG TPA: Abi-alpha family protein [Solirubrobacteraceae bacterium]|nr:Abi-alpha family protein [Solirubrobacteraceae bacterium]